MVEPQDQDMTEATRQRWQAENMGERYIYLIDDLERLKGMGLPLGDLDSSFFRYHEYHLWDRFISHQINILEDFAKGDKTPMLISSMERFSENWMRIQKLPTYLDSEFEKKSLYTNIEAAIGLSTLFIDSNFDPEIGAMLKRQRELHSIRVYDFAISQG
mgnify:CR=1 FL=1